MVSILFDRGITGLLRGLVEGSVGTLSSPLGASPLLELVIRLGLAIDSLFIDAKAVILRDLLPGFDLAIDAVDLLLELIIGGAELGNGLLSKKLFQGPLLDCLLFILLELGDVADCIG